MHGKQMAEIRTEKKRFFYGAYATLPLTNKFMVMITPSEYIVAVWWTQSERKIHLIRY